MRYLVCGTVARPCRRRFQRGLKRRPLSLIKKLRKSKKACVTVEDKPVVVNTHLRDMIIVPEMIGTVVGVYNGKLFTQVEIKVFINIFLDSSNFTRFRCVAGNGWILLG